MYNKTIIDSKLATSSHRITNFHIEILHVTGSTIQLISNFEIHESNAC